MTTRIFTGGTFMASKRPRRRVLAPGVTLLAILSLLAVMTVMLASPPAAHAYDDQELAFLTLINNYRAQNGLGPLTLSSSLSSASWGHSYDMAVHNYFSHTGSDGSSPWDRIRAAGYGYNTYLGENIAAGYDGSAQTMFNLWANSAPHRENMLSSNFHAIGIGRAYSRYSAYGWYWTTDFGGVAEDTTPPGVSVPYPTGSASVSGKVTIAGYAWDNVAVRQVNIYLDGALVNSCLASSCGSTFDTTTYANGTQHTITANAWDTAGLINSASATVTIDNFTPAYNYLFTWYDQQSPGMQDWVLAANPSTGTGSARMNMQVGQYNYADRTMAPGAPAETPQVPGLMGGPVTVNTTQPLIASQRVLYFNSFNETPAVRSDRLESTYYFTWYDSRPQNGMNGDWILIGNQGSATANVNVYIGTQLMGTYAIAPGDKVTPSWPNVTDGPVKVTCTNGQPLIVSQRVLFLGSFSEVLGVPESQLTTQYTFPWYDSRPQSGMNGNWILIGNEDTGDAAVDVYIAGQKMGSYTVHQGDRVTPSYDGTMGGPVRVVSTNGKKLIVSQRVLFMSSFEEVQGLSQDQASTDQWFTWYDSVPSHGMGGNWVLVTNSGASDATVDIYVAGNLMSHVNVPAGGNLPLSYSNLMGGPVRVISTNGQPLFVTQRVIYKNSFNEIAGITP